MRYLVVANPGAGSTDAVEEAVAVLDGSGGCDLTWSETPDDLDRALEFDGTVVIAGGDGSIHLVVNRMARLGRLDHPVGILPMGTGNDLARGLGLPLDPLEAAAQLVEADKTELPLLRAPDGEVGTNNAHTGLGVAAARRGAGWKERLGAFAYPAGSLVEGLAYDGLAAEVEVDGAVIHEGWCLAVMVLVGPSAGGGFRPLDNVNLAEPAVDVLVIGADEEPGRAGLVVSALRGDLSEDDEVIHHRGRHVVASVDGEEWELDGEFRTWEDPVELFLDERTWWVLA